MTLPTFDAAVHDIGIGASSGTIYGFMFPKSKRGMAPIEAVARADALPATDRSADGRAKYDFYTNDSYWAQDEWGGGIGQPSFSAADKYASGLGDGAIEGRFFPARKLRTSNDGGSSYWPISYGSTLYGWNDLATDAIETIVDSGATASRNLAANGSLTSKPDFTAAGNIVFVANESGTYNAYTWNRSGASAPVAITPTAFTPAIIRRWGRHIWATGQRVIESTASIVQSNSNDSGSFTVSATSGKATLANNPRPNSILVGGFMTSTTNVGASAIPSGWNTIVEYRSVGGASIGIYYCVVGASTSGKSFSLTFSTAVEKYLVWVAEVDGLDVDDPLLGHSSTSAAANPCDPIAAPSPSGNAVVFSCSMRAGAATGRGGGSAGYSNLASHNTAAGADSSAYVDYRLETNSTDPGAFNFSSSGTWVNAVAAFACNSISSDLTQTAFLYSEDDGATWRECLQGDSVGIPLPIEMFPAGEYLWITCEDGLYQATIVEQTYDNQIDRVMLGIVGPVDRWHYPKDAGSIGKHIVVFNGIVYYPVGHTIRRYVNNGTGEVIWPPHGYGGPSGAIQGVAAGDDGVYFGAGGFLVRYNERGFQVLAKEASAGQYDYLYWFKGRLYCKGDPAPYYDFGYPGTHPFAYTVDPDDWDVGYWVSSIIDFGKLDAYKVLAEFGLRGSFSASVNGGTIKLQYRNADDAGTRPEYIFGGDSGNTLTWTDIGTLSSSEGGAKRLTLTTPIELRRIILRCVLTPGSAGIPVLEGVSMYGESLLPRTVRLASTLEISRETLGKNGVRLYATAAEMTEAIDFLQSLRSPDGSGDWCRVVYIEPDGDVETHLAIAEQFNDTLRYSDGGWTGYHGVFIARQISGTAIT